MLLGNYKSNKLLKICLKISKQIWYKEIRVDLTRHEMVNEDNNSFHTCDYNILMYHST